MSGLLGGNTKAQKITPAKALQVQTSLAGVPRPIGYGQARLAGNLIWYGDFTATPQKQSGGKGIGGSSGKGGTSQYTYTAAMLFGLCEGPINSVLQVWNNQTAQTLASLGLTVLNGSYSQSPWAYLTTNHVAQALNYRGLALVGAGPLNMGNSPAAPNLSYEVVFNFNNAIAGLPDADPKDIVTDVITNQFYGVSPGAAWVGNLSNFSTYCRAAGVVLSTVISQPRSAQDLIGQILDATNSWGFFSQGVFNIVPLGDENITANGSTYTAPSAPIYDITDQDLLPLQSAGSLPASSSGSVQGPIRVARSDPSTVKNVIPVKFSDRANSYNPDSVSRYDAASVAIRGPVPMDAKQYDSLICDRGVAQRVGDLIKGRQQIRNYYMYTVRRKFILLDPGDIVTLTDLSLGLNRQWVRISEITENQDKTLTLVAEQYLQGTGAAASHASQGNSGYNPNFNVTPGSAITPVIFEVPVGLSTSGLGLEVWIATAGSLTTWGGADVWTSSDNITYVKAGTITQPSRMGVLTGTFASGSDPDTVNTLAVDISESAGVLSGGTQADADTGQTACYVDAEYVSYQQATLTGPYAYSLGKFGVNPGYLRRGRYGSSIASHPIGSPFVRLDGNVFRLPYTKDDIGRTVYLKFLSFNIYGGGQQQLSDVSPYTHVLGGPPTIFAPTNLTVTSTLKSLTLNWVNPPNVGVAAVEIWRSTSSSFAGATKIADAAAFATSWVDQNVSTTTQYWYWIRVRDIAGNEGPYQPPSAGAGISAFPSMLNGGDIVPGTVNYTAFASTIAVPGVVSSLPLTGTEGQLVVLTTDGKLYRYHNGAWTAAVPATDITGQLVNAQIAAGAVNTAQFAAGITVPTIVSSLPGSGTEGQLVYNSTDGKVYRWHSGSWTAQTAATDLAGTINGSQIAVGAITANNIAAGTITAGQIAAGAIGTTQLASQSIIASKLAIASFSNIIGSTDLGDLTYWAPFTGTFVLWTAPTDLNNMPGRPARGIASLGTGANKSTVLDIWLSANQIQFEPSNATTTTVYRVALDAYVGAGFNGQIQYYINWYGGNNSYITTTGSAPASWNFLGTPSATTQLLPTLDSLISVPVGAAQGQFVIQVAWANAASAGGCVIANPRITRADSGELTVDGSITGNKIQANTITATNIAAGSLSADRLVANSITAAQIAVGAIGANQIAANAISANNIQANTIQAVHIVGGAVSTLAVQNAPSFGPVTAPTTFTDVPGCSNTFTTPNFAVTGIRVELNCEMLNYTAGTGCLLSFQIVRVVSGVPTIISSSGPNNTQPSQGNSVTQYSFVIWDLTAPQNVSATYKVQWKASTAQVMGLHNINLFSLVLNK